MDGIVLWTKNPIPLLDRMQALEPFTWYFQYTLNPYGRDIENSLPDEQTRVQALRDIAKRYGAQRVVWRYDPIFFSEQHTVQWHEEHFRRLCEALSGYTDTCNTSFLHMYAKTKRNTAALGLHPGNADQQLELLAKWDKISKDNGIQLQLCATPEIRETSGLMAATCVDAERLSKIGGVELACKKDPNQREDCNCAPSIDIGEYDSCVHGCAYCYANASRRGAERGLARHNPTSPILLGEVGREEVVSERRMHLFAKSPAKGKQLFLDGYL